MPNQLDILVPASLGPDAPEIVAGFGAMSPKLAWIFLMGAFPCAGMQMKQDASDKNW